MPYDFTLSGNRWHTTNRTAGKGAWSDVVLLLGVMFLLISIVVFALIGLSPAGVTHPSSWDPALDALGGVFGISLIGLGLWHRRHEHRR